MNIKEAHKESDNRCSDTIGEQLQPQACRLNASSRLVQIVNQLNGIATKSDELAVHWIKPVAAATNCPCAR